MRSTFGFALDAAELPPLLETLAAVDRLIDPGEVPAGVERLGRRLARDLAILQATGRWDGDAPLRGEYVAGDVLGLRVRYASPGVGVAAAMLLSDSEPLPPEQTDLRASLSVAAALYDAACYFLPVTSAAGILGSSPPAVADLADLRLPFPLAAVYFGADLAIPEQLLVWPDELPARLAASREIGRPLAERLPDADRLLHFGDSIIGDVAAHGGFLSGVLLFADEDFGLADLAGFLVAADGPMPGPRERVRGVVLGRLSDSTLAPLLHNLAAAVAWGAWQPPETLELPETADSSLWRAALRRGQFRRKEPRGALAEVRVLDTARMLRPRPPEAGGSGHASPVTHLRRGYWQRHRLGPQARWHYEMRFHPPTLVNPGRGRGQTQRPTVYRLPLPPT